MGLRGAYEREAEIGALFVQQGTGLYLGCNCRIIANAGATFSSRADGQFVAKTPVSPEGDFPDIE